jgi:uncharacterized membrane protein YhaH (DUF805 family)
MSKPVFKNVFTLSGRRNRQSFILFTLFTFLCLAATLGSTIAATVYVAPDGPVQSLSDVPTILTWIFMIPMVVITPVIVGSCLVGAQRCRDFGWTGWAVFISGIPIAGFIFSMALLFTPGTKGPNRYGPDPLQA